MCVTELIFVLDERGIVCVTFGVKGKSESQLLVLPLSVRVYGWPLWLRLRQLGSCSERLEQFSKPIMVSQTSREAISGAEIYYLLTPSLTAPGKYTMGHHHFRDTLKLPITSFHCEKLWTFDDALLTRYRVRPLIHRSRVHWNVWNKIHFCSAKIRKWQKW